MFQNPWYGQTGVPGAADDANHDDARDPPPSAARPEKSQRDEQPTGDSATQPDLLQLIRQKLKPGWTVHLNQDGRLFYCNHVNQTSSWLPPIENWAGGVAANTPALPYGWEAAVDREGKPYFINHLNKTTTYEDPRKDWAEEPPQPRQVVLQRHPELGFGFVAGSEKPVIVRFVTEGGPSVDKLLPGDQVWQINGEDVRTAPRDHVIQLVRSCKESVQLTVCQPPVDTTGRKSALLSAAKKAKLKSNPSRVRFAEGVVINGSALPAAQAYAKDGENSVPLMPNVMKVYLENGQTKSFKYDSATTVSDVLASLQQKLGFKSMDHFSLCVEHVKSLRRNKLTLLDPAESLAWIAARPGSHNLRCLLRVAFVPKDSYDLLRKDTGAFEYLYMQCCNDVVQERFAPELKYDIALRLAALHMYQHAMSNKMQAKITVKTIEQEYGLERFVPLSLVEAMKRKELRKLLSHFFKVNGQLTAPGQKQLTALQAKLHYLKIIAELPSYGAKCFSTNLKDSNVESVILISPKYGISHISGLRSSNPISLCNIEDVTSLNVRREDELTEHVEIRLKDPDKETLQLGLEEKEAEELILVLRGYHKLLADRALPVHREKNRWTEDSAPPYHTRHTVEYTPWSFLTSQRSAPDTPGRRVRFADFSVPPPYHPPPEDFHIPDGSYPPFVEEDFEAETEEAEARGVALSLSPQVNVDSNMNKAVPNNNVSRSLFFGKRSSTLETAIPGHKLGFDMPSVVSMEILESQRDCSEARNDAVIQRVSEMKRLVEESEQYLTDDVRHPEADTASLMSEVSQLSKTESDASSAYGRLRHSDSLLLLTQGQKQLSLPDNSTILIDATEPSSSDTDTPNATPTHSPSQRPKAGDKHARPASMLRPSDSSFGLHSPDVLPASITNQEDLMKRLKDDPSLPFAEGTLYLDPDIIDLTMIPPPITPEEDGIKLPLTISEPPTPFADRESLENELKNPLGIEMPDLGELRELTDLAQWSDVLSDSANDSKEDLTSLDSSKRVQLSQSANLTGKRSTNHDPALERLLTKIAVPPPPSSSGKINAVPEMNEDLSAYIIPPPPSTTNNLKAMAILQKLNAAREGIFQVMHGDTLEAEEEKDCGVAEVRIRSEQRERSSNPTPKTGLFSSVIAEKTTPDLSPSSSHSSGYGSLKSIVDISAPELPARVPKSGSLTPKKNGLVGSSISRIGMGLIAAQEEEDDDIPPPPPPPRISSQRSGGTMQRSPVKAKPANPPPPPPGVLVKSSSQGNLLEKRPAAERLLPKKMSAPHLPGKAMSVSTESLTVSQSPSTALSPSKLSITSSNDSLSSNTSVATVKAAHPTTSGDTTPPLPPRGSPTRVVMRPPLPATHSQETVKMATSRGLTSPTSPRRAAAADTVSQRPPSLPSRLRKPGPPVVPKTNQKQTKSAAPPPPVVQQPVELHYAVPHSSKIPVSLKNSPASMNGSPVKDSMVSGSPLRDFKDFTSSPKRQMEASGGRAAPPLLTSSPKMNARHNAASIGSNVISVSIQPDKQMNGRVNADGSVDSGSFEQDSLDGGAEVDLVVLCSQSESTINRVISRLVVHGDTANPDLEDRDLVESARDRLINESRHFVTASKMFVKSVTESAEAMSTCLSQCVSLIERMADATDPLTHSHMGRDLIPKVRDVSRAFLHTVRAAAEAFGQGATDPSMGRLMSKATALAGVLTILMRSLRP